MFDTTKIEIFKQITTSESEEGVFLSCVWYHKDRNFQANHNPAYESLVSHQVVFDTTKIEIFKQITTTFRDMMKELGLCLIPQR